MLQSKDWGIYVYFAADVPSAAMRSAAKRNLQKIADVGSNDKVGITAMVDLMNEPTRWFVIPEVPKGKENWIVTPVQTERGNVNSASTETIRRFFDWSLEKCPAKNIGFVFWGHGYAIDDFDPRFLPHGPIFPDAPEFKFSEESSAGFERPEDSAPSSIQAVYFADSKHLPLKLLFDATHNAVLNNSQVGDVIRDCRKKLPRGKKLAILGFDCCNMAMAEVLCEMQGCAELVVAAETALPYASWISDTMLGRILRNPPDAAEIFATSAVQDFIRSFAKRPTIYLALSACDPARSKSLEIAVKTLAQALKVAAKDSEYRSAIFKSRNDCPSYDPDGFIDFDCFCGFLSEDLAGTEVSKACGPVREALHRLVIASDFSPKREDQRISLSTGLSVWFPPWIENPAMALPQKMQSIRYLYEGYRRTQFARSTGWDDFLLTLVSETRASENGGHNEG